MRDYTLNLENSKKFILRYERIGDELVIYLASNEQLGIPYSIESERIILEKMRNQVIASHNFQQKQEKNMSKNVKRIVWDVSMLSLNIFTISTGARIGTPIAWVCTAWFTLDLAYSIYSAVKAYRDVKDIEKHNLFLSNEDLINGRTKVVPPVDVPRLTNIPTSVVIEEEKNDDRVTLNDVDAMSYDELENMILDINRELEFRKEFNLGDDTPMVLSKTVKGS